LAAGRGAVDNRGGTGSTHGGRFSRGCGSGVGTPARHRGCRAWAISTIDKICYQ
jgi:hypothetical protein